MVATRRSTIPFKGVAVTEETTPLWRYIKREIMGRYPGLSMRKMSIDAGLAENTVGKIKSGHIPKADTLMELAKEWGRTPEEVQKDYQEMLKRAGLALDDDLILTDEEKDWVKRYRGLAPEQRRMIRLFFEAYDMGAPLDVLSRGLPAAPDEALSDSDDAFTTFLKLLGEMAEISPVERIWLMFDALRRYREEKGIPGDNDGGNGA